MLQNRIGKCTAPKSDVEGRRTDRDADFAKEDGVPALRGGVFSDHSNSAIWQMRTTMKTQKAARSLNPHSQRWWRGPTPCLFLLPHVVHLIRERYQVVPNDERQRRLVVILEYARVNVKWQGFLVQVAIQTLVNRLSIMGLVSVQDYEMMTGFTNMYRPIEMIL